jgi:predicted RNA-binding protein associated with RNAse of E/G family
MGETHGHENQITFRVLAELTPIEEISIRQNGWRMIYFHHRDTEHTEVSQRILNEVFRIRLYEAKALKARLISAMGETHGHENQTQSRVLAELTPIEEISIRQNGWRMIYFHHRDTEHTEVSQRILNEVFCVRLYEAKALKARLISAMGETHDHENQTQSRVLAEMAPIEKIMVRQNGWRMIYFHHRDTEHTEVYTANS